MEECHRILKPGGTLRLCVPILDRIIDRTHQRDLITKHGHQMVYNFSNIKTMLEVAGFETVVETGRRQCDGHHKVIGEARDDLETLRVEARKAP
jgi:predicted SAM-dependent methyltransferase